MMKHTRNGKPFQSIRCCIVSYFRALAIPTSTKNSSFGGILMDNSQERFYNLFQKLWAFIVFALATLSHVWIILLYLLYVLCQHFQLNNKNNARWSNEELLLAVQCMYELWFYYCYYYSLLLLYYFYLFYLLLLLFTLIRSCLTLYAPSEPYGLRT
jgi:hypothetical protein